MNAGVFPRSSFRVLAELPAPALLLDLPRPICLLAVSRCLSLLLALGPHLPDPVHLSRPQPPVLLPLGFLLLPQALEQLLPLPEVCPDVPHEIVELVVPGPLPPVAELSQLLPGAQQGPWPGEN